jgi:hypothetical protein
MDRYDTWSKRKLLKEVYRAWKALGVRVRRGQTFGPLRQVKQTIDEIFDYLAGEHGEDWERFKAEPQQVQIDTIAIARRKLRDERT